MRMDHILRQVKARTQHFVRSASFKGPDFKKKVRESQGTYTLATQEAGTVTVVSDDDSPQVQQFREKYGDSDLMSVVPNIQLRIDGRVVFLTWNEAYNLGFALQASAETAFYG